MRTLTLCLTLWTFTACSSSEPGLPYPPTHLGGAPAGGNANAPSSGGAGSSLGGSSTSTVGGSSTSTVGGSSTSMVGGANVGGRSAIEPSGSGGTAGGARHTGGASSVGSSSATGGTTSSSGSGGAIPSNGGKTATSSGGSTAAGGTSSLGGRAGSAAGGASHVAGSSNTHWVGTWATAQQLTEPNNDPPSPGLTNNTLRQIAHVSIGGQRLRIRFSNDYGSSPVTLNEVHCATSTGGHSINTRTDKALTFNGTASVTIPAKQSVTSDPFDFELAPLSNLAVTIYFGTTSSDVTGHPGSRATSYLQSGNAVTAASMPSAAATDHWYVLSGVDVMADANTHAVVILGDSITDGRGSTTNGNDRWPDALARRLQANAATAKIGVLNMGIGGNQVLSGGLGPTAAARFDNDVLRQNGVRWLILLEGVNDIGNAGSGSTVTTNLINTYKQFVAKARAANIKAYGSPILPFNGHAYYSTDHESARKTVNEWIRANGNFDAVIDLDAAVRGSAKPDTLAAAFDQGDHLHLNPTGYQKMADAVPLTLFSP